MQINPFPYFQINSINLHRFELIKISKFETNLQVEFRFETILNGWKGGVRKKIETAKNRKFLSVTRVSPHPSVQRSTQRRATREIDRPILQ